MANVYIWPACLGGSSIYGDQNRVRSVRTLWGGPGQKVAATPRVPVTISGEVVRSNADDLWVFLDRLAGGVNKAGLWDLERVRFGWDAEAAFNTSTGAEFWHVTGQTSTYNDDAADGTTWRSINAQANGAALADATSIAIDGLLPGEVIPKGCLLRPSGSNHRYMARASVTANGSGQATVQLAHPLRAGVSDGANIRVPGDFGVFSLLAADVGEADSDGVATFRLTFLEDYEAEVSGGFTYVVD